MIVALLVVQLRLVHSKAAVAIQFHHADAADAADAVDYGHGVVLTAFGRYCLIQ